METLGRVALRVANGERNADIPFAAYYKQPPD